MIDKLCWTVTGPVVAKAAKVLHTTTKFVHRHSYIAHRIIKHKVLVGATTLVCIGTGLATMWPDHPLPTFVPFFTPHVVVPEPSSLLLFATGCIILFMIRKRISSK